MGEGCTDAGLKGVTTDVCIFGGMLHLKVQHAPKSIDRVGGHLWIGGPAEKNVRFVLKIMQNELACASNRNKTVFAHYRIMSNQF